MESKEKAELKSAALVVMRDGFKEDFDKMYENEKEFVQCFHDILFDMNMAAEEENADNTERRFSSTYQFPDTLRNIQKAIELYNRHLHIMSCIKMWSEY